MSQRPESELKSELTLQGVTTMVENAIRRYDADIVLPREERIKEDYKRADLQIVKDQRKEHEANTDWLKRLDKSMNSLKDDLVDMSQKMAEWKWPMRVILAMLTAILLGVTALVGDLLKWGLANHWNYLIGR